MNAVRAWEAVARGDAVSIAREASLALEWVPQDNLAVRTTAHCAIGVAHQFSGDRLAAQHVYGEVVAMAEACGNRMFTVVASIALGLSNQEIGRQLFVSLSTVKWHNQNIFDKLDVQRRTEAVARAQELNLL